jgi:serine kinase
LYIAMPTSSTSCSAAAPPTAEGNTTRPPSGKGPPATPSSSPSGGSGTSASFKTILNSRGYVLGKTLGTGTYGKVKYAHSLRLKHPVAVKIVSRKVAKDVHLKFLPRELDALRCLHHRNIIQLVDVLETQEHMYIIMELAEGGDLLDYINKKRFLAEEDAKGLFHDLVDGLVECHRLRFVHRDLKCENMLLSRNFRLKISDFGFARRFTETQKLQTYCGSYAYAAPEIIIGEPYLGPTADIWSIGVILYAMVCGKLPFKDKDAKSLLSDVASKLHFPSRINDQCRDLIKGILRFNPQDRLTLEEIKTHPWMVMRPISTPSLTPELPVDHLPPPLPLRTYKQRSVDESRPTTPLEFVESETTLPPPIPPRSNEPSPPAHQSVGSQTIPTTS